MNNQIIVSKNHIYQVNCNDGLQLAVKDYAVDIPSLSVKFERNFQWGCKTNVRILAASSAREMLTGSNLPMVLVAVGNKSKPIAEIKCYILCLETENVSALKMLKMKREFVSFSHSNVSCSTVRLLDGPTVLVHAVDGMMYYSSQDSCFLESFFYPYKTIDVSLYNACCNDAKVKGCDSLEFVQTYRKMNRHIVFTCMKLATSCPIHQNKLLKVLHACVIESHKICDIHIGKFIPIEYVTTVSCLCIQTIDNDSNLSGDLFIGTSDGFVLHLSNGHVMNCISLSESDIALMDGNCISSINYGAPVDEQKGQLKLLISQMKETELKVLNKEFKVESTYKDVLKVLEGDFAQNGTNQFLLMKDRDIENAQWILTDLFSVNLCNEADAKQVTGGDSVQSCGTVVQALRSRLQKETMGVEEQAKFCQERESFLRNIYTRYNPCRKTSRDWRLTSQKTSLVPLVTDRHGNRRLAQSSVFQDMPSVKVQEIWQRTFRGQWCIGADLVNTSDRDVQVSLTVVHCDCTDKRSTRCHSKLTHCSIKPTDSNSLICGQSDQKKQKLMGMIEGTVTSPHPRTGTNFGHCTAVCVTPVPDFSMSDQYSLLVMLDMSIPPSTHECLEKLESCGEVGKSQTDGSQHSWQIPCGQMTLYGRDVIYGRHEVKLETSLKNDGDFQELKDLQRDKAAWREAQTLTHILMRSSPGILSGLDKLLIDRCGLLYSTGLDCYYTMQDGLQNVQLVLGLVQYKNNRDLDIYSSCDRSLFLMIHHLYNCLPDHILILPRDTRSSLHKQNFLLSMGKEIHFLSDGIAKLLNLNETQVVKSDSDSDPDEDCNRKVGEKFKISRERLFKKQLVPLNRERMLELSRQEAELHRKTDLALAMCEPR